MSAVDALFAGVPQQAPPAQAATPTQASDPHGAVDALFAGATAQKQATPKLGLRDYVGGALEPIAQMASATLATPLAGLAGLAVEPFRGNAGAAKTVENVENALTYQPRTRGGQAVSNVLNYVPSKIAHGADYVGGKVASATGSPLAGAVTNGLLQVAPMLLASKVPALREARVETSRIPSEVASARSANYKLTPTEAQVPGGILGRTTESLSGSAKLEREVSRENAPQVTQNTANELGVEVGKNGRVTPQAISDAKAPHLAVYDELKSLGAIPTDETFRGIVGGQKAPGEASFPKAQDTRVAALREAYSVPQFDAADALAKIQELREEGNSRVYAGGKPDVAERKYGRAQLAIARALEDQIDRHLQGLANGPQPDRAAFMRDFEAATKPNPASPGSRTMGSAVLDLAPNPAEPNAVHIASLESGGSAPVALRRLLTLADKHGVDLTTDAQPMGEGGIARAPLIEHYKAAGFNPEVEDDGWSPLYMRRPANATAQAQADFAKQAQDLIPRYRNARMQLAKLANLERAVKVGKGNVSALNLAKQLDRGAPLSGTLRTAAEAAQNFPRAFQDINKIRDSGPLSNLDFKLGAPLALIKPEALALFAGPPGIRALLRSERYQRRAFGPESKPLIPSVPSLKRGGRALLVPPVSPALAADSRVTQSR